ncbi:hypothetical protein [Duganella callida]|uniref:Uncharacterized protein n=1 Tax=Duganella callida TaxID=2561932 RepID=A0A4Y9SAT1_9BURK|nr:hypothetical protein [Duganella callida]TFW17266.1 hypothetical protein E4L98_21085 [Duganella callida]
MPTKFVDGYEIEFTGEPLPGCDQWGAYVAIFGVSDNPMHLTNLYPRQRVAADVILASEAAAEQAAERAGMRILEELRAAPAKAG